jgi:hypothetical protein
LTTNKIYRSLGTPIRFKDSDATYTLTTNNLAAGAGRISDRWDRGDAHLPMWYRWKCVIQFETAPVVGEYVEIVKSESDGTNEDGNVGTADAALTAGQKLNCKTIGIVRVQTTDAAADFIASGMTLIVERYVSFGIWNASADNLKATNDLSWVELTPVIEEVEAAA